MLKRFEVCNFKNFERNVVLDLSNVKGYEFNTNLIDNNHVRCAAIFGKNSSGKSNICKALLDIVNHLTDNRKTTSDVLPYVNLNSEKKTVDFVYEFIFDNKELKYAYSKRSPEELDYEKLIINGETYIEYNFFTHEGYCKLKGTENLNKKLTDNTLSFVKYINNNSILEDNEVNHTFKKFIQYVNNMLLFYSLEGNQYFGFTSGSSETISDSIVKKGKLEDFNQFLNKLDIECHLISREINGKYEIFNQFKNGEANFFLTASTGTKALTLFYYWLINAAEASLIIMDEFDAFYHFELSEEIVKEIIKETSGQVIFTSHNTNLMDTDLFRPDCLFLIQKNGIKSLADLTDKELRKAHNLQKMYKAGLFDE